MNVLLGKDLENALALIRGVYNRLPAGSEPEEQLLDAETLITNAQALLPHTAARPDPNT